MLDRKVRGVPLRAPSLLPGVLTVLGATAEVRAADGDPAWLVRTAGWATSPLVLQVSPVVGAQVSVDRPLAAAPWLLSARLAWGINGGNSEQVVLSHHHLQASVGGGVRYPVGRGTVWATVHLGARAVVERQERYQRRRLRAAGLPVRIATTWMVTPVAEVDLGVALRLRQRWRVVTSLGPWVGASLRERDRRRRVRVGWQASLGVAYGFGGSDAD